jgi:hypothetical protein
MSSPINLLKAPAFLAAAFLLLCGCSEYRTVWREQKLTSGKIVKVTSCHFTWGIEHDVRTPGNDSFALEFVYTTPDAGDDAREREAKDVFELIRPISEQWAVQTASLAGFPTTTRKGEYDLYFFKRAADGQWSCERSSRKVFANE